MRATSLLATIAVLAVGCGATGDDVIDTEDLQRTVSEQLDDNGHDHDSVSCPEPLSAKATEATRCVMTSGGTEHGVSVLVTSVDDGEARYDIRLDDAPRPSR